MAPSGSCGICEENFIVNSRYVVCFCCGKTFHNMCVKIKDPVSKAVVDIPNILWFCDLCIETVEHKIKGENKILDKLKELETKTDVMIERSTRYFSSISKANSPTVTDIGKTAERNYAKVLKEGVLIVKPTLECESKETKKNLEKKLNKIPLNIGIAGMREAKNGSVVVKCKDNKEANKLRITIEKNLGEHFSSAVPSKRKPCIKIVGIEKEYSELELLDALKLQNSEVFLEGCELKLVVTKRMVKSYFAIVQCDPKTFNKIQSEAEFRLFIGLRACRCFEHINVYRCYNCNKYGHSSRNCSDSKSCGKCCGSTHDTKDCSSQELICTNCKTSNEKHNLGLSINHSAYSMACPTYLHLLQQEKSKIQYQNEI